tara:strand:- start:238 stop:498 length:261 start_codon:yes stop_codon:yes gene_type:complete
MSALLDSHQELLRFAIAERDAFYDCATDHEGAFNDKHDHDELERMDAMIDRAQEIQKNHSGDANKMVTPDHIPNTGQMVTTEGGTA